MKKNIFPLMLNIIVLAFLLSFMKVVAASGDFTLTLRMVKGYENGQTYSFSSDVKKTVSLSAKYVYTIPDNYYVVHKFNKLSVSVYRHKKVLFVFNKWSEYETFDCTYSNDKFSLSKSINLTKGEYGFAVWRTNEEAYYDRYGQPLSIISVEGNVKFK